MNNAFGAYHMSRSIQSVGDVVFEKKLHGETYLKMPSDMCWGFGEITIN